LHYFFLAARTDLDLAKLRVAGRHISSVESLSMAERTFRIAK